MTIIIRGQNRDSYMWRIHARTEQDMIPGQYSSSDMLLNKDDTVWTNVDVVRYRLHQIHHLHIVSVIRAEITTV